MSGENRWFTRRLAIGFDWQGLGVPMGIPMGVPIMGIPAVVSGDGGVRGVDNSSFSNLVWR